MYLPGKENFLSGCHNVLFTINYIYFCLKGKECHAWANRIRIQLVQKAA